MQPAYAKADTGRWIEDTGFVRRLLHDDDDDSLLDKITDILSSPLPGTEQTPDAPRGGAQAQPENPGETAVRDAEEPDADPVSTTAAAGADWMQREYERFNAHQEHSRQAFAEQQRVEQERFSAYQRAQLDQIMKSQAREREVFKRHQEARFQMWRQDLRHAYASPPGMPAAGNAASAATPALVAQALTGIKPDRGSYSIPLSRAPNPCR